MAYTIDKDYAEELSKFYADNIGIGSDDEFYFRQGYLAGQHHAPAPTVAPDAIALNKLIEKWRKHANGHYCQTYNQGMGEGLIMCADELEGLLDDSRAACEAAASEAIK